MAKVVSTAYVDDLDGSEATGPVDFSLDGKDYTIDLSDSNAARLRDALAAFVASARRASGTGRRRLTSSSPTRSASGRSREETQEIRAALRELGYSVKDRGGFRPSSWRRTRPGLRPVRAGRRRTARMAARLGHSPPRTSGPPVAMARGSM